MTDPDTLPERHSPSAVGPGPENGAGQQFEDGHRQGEESGPVGESLSDKEGYGELGRDPRSAPVGGQDGPSAADKVALEEALATLSALGRKVENIAAQNETLARENSDLKASLNTLSAQGQPPLLEDICRLFRSRSYDPSILAGAHRDEFQKHLIIPIHPPKIGHVSNIFSRAAHPPQSEDVLLTFITTSAAERTLVERYIALTHPRLPGNYEVISIMELSESMGFALLSAEMARTEAAIINIKKVLGLYRAFYLGAQHVICMDSDALFLTTPDDLFAIACRNYEHKVFMAAYSPIEITDQVVLASANYFLEDESRRLRALIGPDQFSWFFDVPYVPSSDGREFLAHISLVHGGIERALLALTWHTFDHILFINHLLLRGDFELVDIRSLVGAAKISDDLALPDLQAVENRHGYRPAWAPLPAILASSEVEAAQKYAVAFHVDRLSASSDSVG